MRTSELAIARPMVRSFAISLVLFIAGCSHLARSYDVAPDGLQRGEHEFRRYLSAGRADSALLRMTHAKKSSALPSDELLRLLFEGVAAHYAGDHQRSAQVFDLASLIADDRTTRSISKAALSVLVNDLSLAYQPTRTERLLLPYYAALTYASSGKYGDAAVEARRLSALLQQLDDQRQAPNARTNAFLRYFAGVMFEAAGERADAEVAYRNAAALDSVNYPLREPVADSLHDVVVFIERGFAPHRVQESLVLLLTDEETHEFEGDRSDEEREQTAATIAQRVLQFASTAGPRTGPPKQRTLWVPAAASKASDRAKQDCDSGCEKHEDHSYLLRMSWPVMYAPPMRGAPNLRIDSMAVTTPQGADLAGEIVADFQRQQPAIVARAVARAATKYVLSKSARKELGKKHEALGDVVGAIANITGALTEQADTRSWHLLPAAIDVVRLRLPSGVHRINVDGVELGAFQVRTRGVTVLSKRLWE